jgi:DNA-binding MarR family transcriptional regulator
MQLAQSTVTELVARAAAAGLVTVGHSKEDGRVTEVRVAPEGERRLTECFDLLGTERRALRDAIADHILVPS